VRPLQRVLTADSNLIDRCHIDFLRWNLSFLLCYSQLFLSVQIIVLEICKLPLSSLIHRLLLSFISLRIHSLFSYLTFFIPLLFGIVPFVKYFRVSPESEWLDLWYQMHSYFILLLVPAYPFVYALFFFFKYKFWDAFLFFCTNEPEESVTVERANLDRFSFPEKRCK
jgi:hypothetical protein